MHLYIIRHAEAVPLGERGISTDEERPLTETGWAQCRTLAGAFSTLGLHLDRILASPLVRARQTAEAIRDASGEIGPSVLECPELAPGARKRDLLERLREHQVRALGIVGHNPDLSELVGWFLGDRHIGVNMEKAGVACIEFDGFPGKGAGILAWLVTPAWCDHVGNASPMHSR